MWQLVGITIVLVAAKSANIECAEGIPTNLQNVLIQPENSDYYDSSLMKQLQKRSIVKLDFHDGPKYEVQRLRSPELLYSEQSFWPDVENDKIISSIEQRRNHALVLQERRNPSFSPWGGKRDSSSYKSDPKIRRPARVPFNSWGGKRDGERIVGNFNEKRGHDSTVIKKPFNSWGGKRSTLIIEDILRLPPNDISSKSWQYPSANIDKSLMDKKTGYNLLRLNNNNNQPRIPFEPWGGRKRTEDSVENEIIFPSSPSLLLTDE